MDITSGKFVFSATEAYLIEGGKVGPAIRGATLIGNGPEVMQRVSMSATISNSTGASASAARTAKPCRSGWVSRP